MLVKYFVCITFCITARLHSLRNYEVRHLQTKSCLIDFPRQETESRESYSEQDVNGYTMTHKRNKKSKSLAQAVKIRAGPLTEKTNYVCQSERNQNESVPPYDDGNKDFKDETSNGSSNEGQYSCSGNIMQNMFLWSFFITVGVVGLVVGLASFIRDMLPTAKHFKEDVSPRGNRPFTELQDIRAAIKKRQARKYSFSCESKKFRPRVEKSMKDNMKGSFLYNVLAIVCYCCVKLWELIFFAMGGFFVHRVNTRKQATRKEKSTKTFYIKLPKYETRKILSTK